jgi:hypothetical protein
VTAGVLLLGIAPAVVAVPGGRIEVTIEASPPALSRADLLSWVEGSARAVASYYGTFPVPAVRLAIRPGGPGKIGGGRTWNTKAGAAIEIYVGDATSAADLMKEWELTHEMVHLAFPSMGRGQSWIEEGLATYVEPIARVRAGRLPSDEIWKWLVWGLPQGDAAVARNGLDGARGQEATYWGGALFCFLADVEIRKRTDNRKSLDDALRGIVRAGGNVTMSWDLPRTFAEGDRATGVPVLTELYERMGRKPMSSNATAVLASLGVSGTRSAVVFDDKAPFAAIRHGIESGKP